MCEFEKYQAYYDDYNDPFIWWFFGIVAILLFLVISSIAFSIFQRNIETPSEPIDPDIVFNYSDVNGMGPGILISDMAATSDEVGKKLSGTQNYFDFTVSGNLKNQAVKYTILLKKDDNSTLDESDVKIYLTQLFGGYETEINSIVPVYSSLSNITVDGDNYKSLYTHKYSNIVTDFSDNYRLRMWIKEDATDYYGEKFSLKVSVFAEGIGD